MASGSAALQHETKAASSPQQLASRFLEISFAELWQALDDANVTTEEIDHCLIADSYPGSRHFLSVCFEEHGESKEGVDKIIQKVIRTASPTWLWFAVTRWDSSLFKQSVFSSLAMLYPDILKMLIDRAEQNALAKTYLNAYVQREQMDTFGYTVSCNVLLTQLGEDYFVKFLKLLNKKTYKKLEEHYPAYVKGLCSLYGLNDVALNPSFAMALLQTFTPSSGNTKEIQVLLLQIRAMLKAPQPIPIDDAKKKLALVYQLLLKDLATDEIPFHTANTLCVVNDFARSFPEDKDQKAEILPKGFLDQYQSALITAYKRNVGINSLLFKTIESIILVHIIPHINSQLDVVGSWKKLIKDLGANKSTLLFIERLPLPAASPHLQELRCFVYKTLLDAYVRDYPKGPELDKTLAIGKTYFQVLDEAKKPIKEEEKTAVITLLKRRKRDREDLECAANLKDAESLFELGCLEKDEKKIESAIGHWLEVINTGEYPFVKLAADKLIAAKAELKPFGDDSAHKQRITDQLLQKTIDMVNTNIKYFEAKKLPKEDHIAYARKNNLFAMHALAVLYSNGSVDDEDGDQLYALLVISIRLLAYTSTSEKSMKHFVVSAKRVADIQRSYLGCLHAMQEGERYSISIIDKALHLRKRQELARWGLHFAASIQDKIFDPKFDFDRAVYEHLTAPHDAKSSVASLNKKELLESYAKGREVAFASKGWIEEMKKASPSVARNPNGKFATAPAHAVIGVEGDTDPSHYQSLGP